MFFEIWVLWGDEGSFALFASGRLGWLLLAWIWLLQGSIWLPRGSILSPLCGSGVNLDPQQPLIAKSLKKDKK